jgi:plasmid stabilization system protein ParE
MDVVFTDEALSDLTRIGDHIAADNPVRALSFIAEIEQRCRSLVVAPLAWPLDRRWAAQGVRRFGHGAYLCFYRVDVQRIVILHIAHGRMNLDSLFDRD